MIPYLREGIGALAGAAIASGIALIVYEGVPLGPLRLIPGVDQIAEGRVESERRRAREGYVQEARVIAAEARLAETERQLSAGRKALDWYAAELADAQAREAAISEQDAQDEESFKAGLGAAGRSRPLDQSDIDWVRR